MKRKIKISDLEEMMEVSEIIYKRIFETKEEFDKLIKETINESQNVYYFITSSLKLGKYEKIDNTYNVTIYSYLIAQETLSFDLLSPDKDIFGRKTIKTGFEYFDERVQMFKGELVVIAGRPAMAKTSFITQLLNNQSRNLNVGIYSLQQSKESYYLKILSQNTSIPLYNLLKNNLDDNQNKNLQRAFEEIEDSFLIDDTNYNLKGLITKIKKDFIFNDFDVVYVDCLQLIKSTASLEYRYLELNQISRELKILAKELNILIVAISTLNRNVESRYNKRPLLNDLRDSGTLEDDADKVLFLYRDDLYRVREEERKIEEAASRGEEYKSKFVNKPIEDIEIIVAKQNNGSAETVRLNFQKQYCRFVEKEDFYDEPIDIDFESGDKIGIEITDILQ
jgi:replicative DNA helicase